MTLPWWAYVAVPGTATLWILLEIWLFKNRTKDLEEEDFS